ncbi:restriction endonuclease subunit S [Tautonia plasticadhaerens]|nr:restriction endonuclease subunit S [Tautonia plasticadhaerens]
MAKIDALVGEQRRLIELLKEKRQAVISHAVTKGLNPHAPMKPSGIEWLGDVPAHWSVTPVSHLCEQVTYGFTNPMPTTEEGPYLLTANDVDYGRVKYETARKTSYEAYRNDLTDKSRPKEGDVLITKDGTLGRVAVHDGRECCINQSVAKLNPKPELILPRFMATCLLGGIYQERMLFDAGGTTIKHIYISRLSKMPVCYPPLPEQKFLLSHLDNELARLDSLCSEGQRAIDLLLERRTALISAAVTGKIDVRGLAESEAA